MDKIREVVFYKHYFFDFFHAQNDKVKEKIDYVLFLVSHIPKIPDKFMKHLEGTKGIYEIRVEYGKNIFRIFCCFDEGNIVVLFNGYQKKSKKTSIKEIEFAKKNMKEYLNDK